MGVGNGVLVRGRGSCCAWWGDVGVVVDVLGGGGIEGVVWGEGGVEGVVWGSS